MVRTEALILPLSIKCVLFLVFLISLNVTTTFCCYSVTQSHPILCNPMDCSTPGLRVPYHLLEFVCPSSRSFHQCCLFSHLILWHPLLLLSSVFPSIRDLSNESSVPIRWPKYWSFNFSISHSSEYSGLISLQFDWFNLFAVQEAFKSLLQHHSSKASILWRSAFFTVQLSQPYVTTGKTIALTIWTFRLPHSQFFKPNS